MNMKNTAILLIFLLAVLGLIMGVCYTEADNIEKTSNDTEEVVLEDSNGTITITLEPKEKNQSLIDKFIS
ncbi:hypothetical protein [Methanobrevibacter sp.]|uniref:hypothetical protein n=1 Tax=Methanobrevibacter sp. TaxID=66852 RepID=UPI003864D25C